MNPSATPTLRPALRFSILRTFGRTTSTGNFIPEIDGLRCVAIALVIAYHLSGYVLEKSPRTFSHSRLDDLFLQLLRTGHIGVQLFFVISGFVVSLPFASHYLRGTNRVNLRRYYVRRLTRIEPPYVIALVFWILVFGFSPIATRPWHELLRHFPASLFYLHNTIYGEPSYILPPAWSLEIEIQFYLIAPLLILIFHVRKSWLRRLILLTSIAALATAQRWLRNPGQINGLNLGHEAHYFLIGMFLVDLHLTRWSSNPTTSGWHYDLIAIACALGLIQVLRTSETHQPLIALLMMLFVANALRSKICLSVLRNPWIYTFGGMCYTTYLYHSFFKAVVGHFTIALQIGNSYWLNFLLQAVLIVPCIVVGSAVVFLVTEKPFMRKTSRHAWIAKTSQSAASNFTVGANIGSKH